MATEEPKTKSLEMRVAELEDKLSKMHISEEEMKTYHKVAAALGTTATAPPGAAAMPQYSYLCYRHWSWQPHQWYWQYQQCYECGPGGPGPTTNPGAFGGLGR